MIKQPLVSIVLATYNWNHTWLSESIDSVLIQTYENFELIIINDASSNNIEKIILAYQKKDKRIIYLKNEKNLWLTQSLNKAISKSNGKYIARIDDDDIWCDENKLKTQVDFMENNPEYWLCGTWVILINKDWKELDRFLNRSWDEVIRKYISWSNQFAHSSIIMRKDIFDKVWWYIDNNITKYTEDYDLWLRIWKVSKLNNLEIYWLKYRVRSWSVSWKKAFIQLWNAFRVYLQYRSNYPNKYSGILKHLISTFMPKWFVKVLVKIYRKFWLI